MLLDSIRILDFDGSLLKQKKLLARFPSRIVDFTEIGPLFRNWADTKTAAKIKSRLDSGLKNAITFLGSGDFHHMSSLLIEQFDQPLSVIVFDHHPDWDGLPPRLGCGSWVSRTLLAGQVKKFVLLGVSSADINAGSLHTADLRALKDDRLEIYPYSHVPSGPVFRKIPKNISVEVNRKAFYNTLHWDELKGKNLDEFFLQVIKRIPTKHVYISIDKDCLKADYSLTNWEEGLLGLDELLRMLRLVKAHLDIVGMDIIGDYSVESVSGAFRAFLARLDHPRNFSARDLPEEVITRVNEETNIRLLEALLGVPSRTFT